jgi:hypothetical protein
MGATQVMEGQEPSTEQVVNSSAQERAMIPLTNFELRNGTTPISRSHLKANAVPNEGRWVPLLDIEFNHVSLTTAPKRVPIEPRPRQEVLTSLERSLQENADVWDELSKL